MEIQHKLSLVILLLSVLSISYSISYSQSNEKPCSEPEALQLDFWIGEWVMTWKNQDGSENVGTNVIRKVLGGCVVEENFTSGNPDGLIGRSYSVYNPAKKTWQQTWIDNSGAYLDFTGGLDGDKMILWRKAVNKAGKGIIQRMVFYEISQNNFYWNWENSTDDGKTWNLVWKIQYSRKA